MKELNLEFSEEVVWSQLVELWVNEQKPIKSQTMRAASCLPSVTCLGFGILVDGL